MRLLRWSALAAPRQAAHVAGRELGPGRRVGLHRHDFAEVFWIKRGRGVHEANGERHDLTEFDLVTISPGDSHRMWAKRGSQLILTNVAFAATTIRFLAKRYFDGSTSFWGRASTPMQLGATHCRWLDGAAQRLADDPMSRFELDSFLLNLIGEVRRSETDDRLILSPQWLRDACRALSTDGNFVGGARRLAQLARRSPEHVARTLKKTAGVTPMQVVTRARMSFAAAQLRLGARPILDISIDCGYESLSHFYTVFGRTFDKSPRRYRLENRAVLPASD